MSLLIENKQACFKKLGLEAGDKFILKHENHENQNQYKNIIFIFDGENILPLGKTDNEKFLVSLMIGRYEIVKTR